MIYKLCGFDDGKKRKISNEKKTRVIPIQTHSVGTREYRIIAVKYLFIIYLFIYLFVYLFIYSFIASSK